jgi:hypothetical protein
VKKYLEAHLQQYYSLMTDLLFRIAEINKSRAADKDQRTQVMGSAWLLVMGNAAASSRPVSPTEAPEGGFEPVKIRRLPLPAGE